MKVGILTFHSSYNFGANLQTLALFSAVQTEVGTPVVIDYRDPDKSAMYQRIVAPEQAKMHERFLQQYLTLSPRLTSANEVEDYCTEELDLVLVGSDAVFRLVPKYEPRHILKKMIGRETDSAFFDATDSLPPYWLHWQSDNGRQLRRASVAASSMGTKFYLLKTSLYRELYRAINDFDFISVRDRWTALMVRCLSLGRTLPVFCPDPVFGLLDHFEIPEDESSPLDVSRTILLSGDFPRAWRRAFAKRARSEGFLLSNLPNPEVTFCFAEADFSIELPLSPLSWYRLLAESAGFIGERFHALVSCVSNQTPVISVDTPRALSIGFRKRNKCCDLWSRIGSKNRFYTMKEIARTPAEAIFDHLFEEAALKKMQTFSSIAKEQFQSTVHAAVGKLS